MKGAYKNHYPDRMWQTVRLPEDYSQYAHLL